MNLQTQNEGCGLLRRSKLAAFIYCVVLFAVAWAIPAATDVGTKLSQGQFDVTSILKALAVFTMTPSCYSPVRPWRGPERDWPSRLSRCLVRWRSVLLIRKGSHWSHVACVSDLGLTGFFLSAPRSFLRQRSR